MDSGFLELANELKNIISCVEQTDIIIENTVKDVVKDLLKLSKPKSKIKKSGYTHLIDSFTYRKKNNEFEIGWGKYYGKWVEDGVHYVRGKHSIFQKAQPHLKPTVEKNYNKYINNIKKNLNLN